MSAKDKRIKIRNLVKEALFIPETKPLDELFEELRKSRKQIAIIVDEYGGTAGIVTMEDILEEIVGEIYDEYDVVKNPFEKINENTYLFDGKVSIADVEKVLEIEIPEGEYDTISGYIIEELGRIPTEKEKAKVENENAIFEVKKVKDRRIVSVKVIKKIS